MDWEYIGDEHKIRALKLAEEIIEQNRYPGVVVTEKMYWGLAMWLFPEAFENPLERLRKLTNPYLGITL